MASEIRVDKINSLSGVGTVTLSPTGVDISGITTVQTLKVGTGVTASEDGDIFFTGVCTATTFTGSGANLTNLPAANLSGTLPAISAANLTNVPAANITGTLPAISAANLTSIPAANITGTLPAISAASLTQIPAANIVGICTAGFERTGGFGGITMCDQWRITSTFGSSNSYLTTNWERQDNPASTYLLSGGGMTESSGVFTFPSTGIYLIHAMTRGNRSDVVSYAGIQIEPTTNNSSYTNMADGFSSVASAHYYFHATAQLIFDVSDTSTHKVKIRVAADGTTNFSGDSDVQMTGATFIRLGDT